MADGGLFLGSPSACLKLFVSPPLYIRAAARFPGWPTNINFNLFSFYKVLCFFLRILFDMLLVGVAGVTVGQDGGIM